MPITFTITADSVAEFDEQIARFASPVTWISVATDTTAVAATEEKPAPATRTRAAKPKAEEAAPVPAQEAEQVSAAPAATSSDSPAQETQAAVEPVAGTVTMEAIKTAMSKFLETNSALATQQALEAATGCKSLTTGSPNVAEKAQIDPAVMQRALDAFVVAAT